MDTEPGTIWGREPTMVLALVQAVCQGPNIQSRSGIVLAGAKNERCQTNGSAVTIERASIARLKKGDIGGLATLVATYQVQAIRTAYLIVRDRQLAEDITQAAFIRAYERIGQFDSDLRFGPWFLRSVANDAIKALERAGRTLTLEVDDDDASLANTLADTAPGPLALLEAAEDAEAVWILLGRLPPQQRAVTVLRYYDGLTDAEIADRLDTPPGTVRWRLFAARTKLRAWLGPSAD